TQRFLSPAGPPPPPRGGPDQAAPCAWPAASVVVAARGRGGRRLCTPSAAIAAWPTATEIWFSPLTTSPAAYRPGTAVSWCASTAISPVPERVTPACSARCALLLQPRNGYTVSKRWRRPSTS